MEMKSNLCAPLQFVLVTVYNQNSIGLYTTEIGAVKGDHVKHLRIHAMNITNDHHSMHNHHLFSKLFDCSIYAKRVCSCSFRSHGYTCMSLVFLPTCTDHVIPRSQTDNCIIFST